MLHALADGSLLAAASVQVLQGADRRAVNFSSKARLRGSFRDAAAPDTVGRLVGAYEVSSSSSKH